MVSFGFITLQKGFGSKCEIIISRWREIGERRKIEAKMFEKAQFTWGK